MLEAQEPDPFEPHKLTRAEQQQLVRRLKKHGLWPLKLPGILDEEKPLSKNQRRKLKELGSRGRLAVRPARRAA